MASSFAHDAAYFVQNKEKKKLQKKAQGFLQESET